VKQIEVNEHGLRLSFIGFNKENKDTDNDRKKDGEDLEIIASDYTDFNTSRF